MYGRSPARKIGAVLMLALAGCEAGPLGPETDTSFFRADIQGAITTRYEGSGFFILGTDSRRPAAPALFSLFSAGRGEASDLAFQLFRPGAELPAVGIYSLSSFVGPTGGDIQATLSRTGSRGETLEMFSASEGELEITHATSERIEGRFRMTAYRSGQQTSGGGFIGGMRPTPETPTIEVIGTFAADLVASMPFTR